MKKRNLKEYFKKMWYSDTDIKKYYEYKKYINDKNKERYKKIEEEHKQEIELIKEYFLKVKVSLKWDWVWCNNDNWRIFIYFYDLKNAINFYK